MVSSLLHLDSFMYPSIHPLSTHPFINSYYPLTLSTHSNTHLSTPLSSHSPTPSSLYSSTHSFICLSSHPFIKPHT